MAVHIFDLEFQPGFIYLCYETLLACDEPYVLKYKQNPWMKFQWTILCYLANTNCSYSELTESHLL